MQYHLQSLRKHEALSVNLANHVEDLYAENNKMLMKEIKDDLKK